MLHSNLACYALVCTVLVSAATATFNLSDALSRAGKILAPGCRSFDYNLLIDEVDGERASTLERIFSKEISEQTLRNELMHANRIKPRRKLLKESSLERIHGYAVEAGLAYCPQILNGSCTSSQHCKEYVQLD